MDDTQHSQSCVSPHLSVPPTPLSEHGTNSVIPPAHNLCEQCGSPRNTQEKCGLYDMDVCCLYCQWAPPTNLGTVHLPKTYSSATSKRRGLSLDGLRQFLRRRR